MTIFSSIMRRLSGTHEQPLLPRHQQPSAADSYSLHSLNPQTTRPKPVFDLSASNMVASTAYHSPLVALERKERQLQRDLQALLDAQSDGLVAGLAGGKADEEASNGTTTPSLSTSGRTGKTMPVRQPVKKKLGLHGARRRILTTVQELSSVKSEESRALEGEVRERDEVLRQVEAFVTKRAGLEEEIAGIENERESKRLVDLREDARALEMEIHELETKLLQMKARHRHILGQISELDNSVQAKLSSYKASLAIVDSQVKRFLARPPLQDAVVTRERPPFLTIPPARRTLEMAREHWATERETLEKRKDEVERERQALDDGATVWDGVLREIGDLEKLIQSEVRRLTFSDKQASLQDTMPPSSGEGMKGILEMMDKVIAAVEDKFKLSQFRDWKLLVCCIGAELEALREGRSLLQGTLDGQSEEKDSNVSEGTGLNGDAPESTDHAREGAYSGEDELQGGAPPPSVLVEGLDEEDDDEPDPELLISHHDTD